MCLSDSQGSMTYTVPCMGEQNGGPLGTVQFSSLRVRLQPMQGSFRAGCESARLMGSVVTIGWQILVCWETKGSCGEPTTLGGGPKGSEAAQALALAASER